MDNILIPGLWLDGSSWDKVVPVLEQAGHRTHPITLPGMESQDADRSRITLRDHVDAVIATIDSIDRADGKAVLVGYSAGAAIAHAAFDARPDRVARIVYVGGFPTGHWPQFTRPEELGSAILDSTVAPPVELSTVTHPVEQTRPEPPLAGDETATLLGSLERQRATFAWKCGGLDEAGLRVALAPSSITLGGLLKHLARVEDDYFSVRLHGRDPRAPWDTVAWDWDWHSAAEDSPEQLFGLWQDSVVRSRSLVAEALADGGLEQLSRYTGWSEPPSMRRILIDLIEEYARHVGHADLIRESIDGLIGEDPPG